MTLNGHCDSRFAPLAEAFARLFDNPQERGAALCLEVAGETVVDLWGGGADKDGEQPWQRDTILNLFSCTKTFTAVAVLQLVAEGKLELDAPVARYWPEFAQAGKAGITVRQFLCHRAGLPALREQLPPEALYDWQAMTAALAGETPWWTPGAEHGYAPITYGWLIGEVIRRVDGREPGAAIVARTAAPLGLDFHIGLGDSRVPPRRAHRPRQGQPGRRCGPAAAADHDDRRHCRTVHPRLHQSAVDPHQHQQAGMAAHAAAGGQWPWQCARAGGLLRWPLAGHVCWKKRCWPS